GGGKERAPEFQIAPAPKGGEPLPERLRLQFQLFVMLETAFTHSFHGPPQSVSFSQKEHNCRL
ncbi:MAG: hypothetical protein K2L18_06480, partial [Acetatifactor sp.]|nr:hypothetical protein [Acetatifactor sp.]